MMNEATAPALSGTEHSVATMADKPTTAEPTETGPVATIAERPRKRAVARRKPTANIRNRKQARATNTKSRNRSRARNRKQGHEMTRMNRFPVQVLNAAKALLKSPAFRNIMMSGTPVTSTPTRKAGHEATTSGRGRGRTAGLYSVMPRKTKVDANPTITKVFNFIKRSKGTTQKNIQDRLELPHSTVWYALVQLRAMKAVQYKAA